MGRYAALDALRGLAALSVFFKHLHGVFFSHHIALDLTPVYMLWAGGEAVILFFVLSGFVLARRQQVGPPQSYGTFLLGRFFRIGVPHLFMLGVAVLSVLLFASLGMHAQGGFVWPQQLDGAQVAAHALLVVDFNSLLYNDVVWTLAHEMRFALVFPLFMVLMTRCSWVKSLGLLVTVSCFAALAVSVGGDPSEGFKTSYVHTLHYLLMFGMGAALLFNLEPLMSRFFALSARRRWMALAGAMLVYVYARMLYLIPQKLGWMELAAFNHFVADALVGLAACIVMVAALTPGAFQRWLSAPWPQFLGRVSFSLYLVHIPVLKTCFTVMPDAPLWLAVMLAIPLVALATLAFHHGVELPAQRWGRRMAEVLAQRRIKPVPPVMDSELLRHD